MIQHVVTLSNGERIGLQEREGQLSIVQLDGHEVDWHICTITPDGVLVYPNSADAVTQITEGLKDG